ncbi:hypothetical protein BDY19DRAFT_547295 [Irpex rosettiformis]|uniref:Uncharacterized protein n=1 Tax=Irpex rosettiformis TaxID=378272 RepID=A0ACB8TQH9_9APHY|nr:hypothetical protein BDY19DRAFT_547295 [Irpex rosettiformis]
MCESRCVLSRGTICSFLIWILPIRLFSSSSHCTVSSTSFRRVLVKLLSTVVRLVATGLSTVHLNPTSKYHIDPGVTQGYALDCTVTMVYLLLDWLSLRDAFWFL